MLLPRWQRASRWLLVALVWELPACASHLGEGTCGYDLSSCAAGSPNTGNAMIQTAQGKDGKSLNEIHGTVRKGEHDSAEDEVARKREARKTKPLRSRLEALEHQVGSLQKRVGSLEGDFGIASSGRDSPREDSTGLLGRKSSGQEHGVSAELYPVFPSDDKDDGDMYDNRDGDSEADAEAPTFRSGDSDDDYEADGSEASILQSSGAISSIDQSIKDRVMVLEADMSNLKDRTHVLEKEIMWSTSNPSLIQASLWRGGGNTWRARIVELEEQGDVLESRVTDLERKVSG